VGPEAAEGAVEARAWEEEVKVQARDEPLTAGRVPGLPTQAGVPVQAVIPLPVSKQVPGPAEIQAAVFFQAAAAGIFFAGAGEALKTAAWAEARTPDGIPAAVLHPTPAREPPTGRRRIAPPGAR